MITIPAYLYDEMPNFVRRVEHMVDAVIEVESFAGKDFTTSPLFRYLATKYLICAGSPVHNDAPYTQNYHGFFRVHKLPVLNSLLPPSTKLSVLSAGGSNDLAFKLRRKRFAIETFHLPPEGGVSERRTNPPPSETRKEQGRVRKPGMGCGSLPGSKDPLEF